MGEKELIQVSFQLPADALEGLAHLVRQLRRLAAESSGGPAPATVERGASGRFDEKRYEALLADRTAPPERIRPEMDGGADAPAAFRAVQARISDPVRAGRAPDRPSQTEEGPLPPPVRAASGSETAQQPPAHTAPEAAARPQAVRETETERPEDIPVLRLPPLSQVEDAPQVDMEPESLIPEAEAVWARASADTAAALPGEPASPPPSPPQSAAGRLPDGPAAVPSRWSGVSEELIAAGPAPLTAEAVSLAFRRDGRRYDNGFPLY